MFRLLVAALVLGSFGWQGAADAQGFRGGRGHDDRHVADMEVFHFLLDNHQKIDRKVKDLPNGIESVTESNDPKVADKIKEHVDAMHWRIEEPSPIRRRDPLFNELFRHASKIKMTVKETEKGVKVTETSDDPYVAKLLQAHALVVSKFVKDGFAEAMKNHPVPGKDVAVKSEKAFPVIDSHGGVYSLPEAVHQPRAGTKILIDVTSPLVPDKLNPGIEKVARYVNIYAGAGKQPADVKIAMVFHGGATLTVLNDEAYRKQFAGKKNPNLELLRKLHEADVEMFVCGQTLNGTGNTSDDVVVFVDTAVSALTASVNLQADGYSYVPLSK